MSTIKKNPFIPPKLPVSIDYAGLIGHITKAHRAIASLNSLLNHLPNPELLGRTMQTKEAVLSSKIEGTQATLNEVFEYEAKDEKKEDSEIKKDIHEIINYREALELGVKSLKKAPLSENLIKKLHSVLLRSGRGRNKAPGEFRKAQVYIGRPGAGIENASFVPPPANEIIPLFSNFEKYLNADKEKDLLVQIAVAHYQFEAIHPFLDGNGRVGRLIISLFLYERQLLSHPFLYLSEFFEEHREDYYELLRSVSGKGKWEAWIRFFLTALAAQAEAAEKTGKAILDLHAKYKEKIVNVNSVYAMNLLDAIFIHPIFRTASIRKDAKIKNTQTFFNLIAKFLDAGIIKDMTPKKRRNKVYAFDELIKLLNK
jgi:Fic family protein